MKVIWRLPATLPSILLAGLWLPSQASAQENPQPRVDEPIDEEIVVRAEREDQSLIDRETYVVRDTPLAQTRNAIDVIQNLPSVTVDASGQLRLLGNRNVKILIDGRDVPNAAIILTTLPASQIERIEVMTNPSAQFSAYGTAGIINVILRRRFAAGVTGSGMMEAGNVDYFTVRLSPKWSDGTWSISASPSFTRSGSRTDRVLERLAVGADPSLDRTEDETGRGTSRTIAATTQISFQPTNSERYDLTGSLTRIDGEGDSSILVSSPSAAFAPFFEISAGKSALDAESLSVERRTTGNRQGEELRLSVSWSHSALSSRMHYVDLPASGRREFFFFNATDQTLTNVKADYTTPLNEGDILSVGAELQWETQRIRDAASGELLSGPVDGANRFAGRTSDMSGYATFQTELASFRLLPGLRVQQRRLEFDSASGLAPIGDTLLFPSLHIERHLGDLVTTFSIARRADWPSIGQFFPYRRVTGPTTIDAGNAALRPERTLNVEAAARLSTAGQQLSLTLYSRQRSNVRDTAIDVTEDSDIISTPVNIGSRLNRGGQFSIRGRFSPHWRYSASAWLADARFNRLAGNILIRDSEREYGGNAQLEYSDGTQGESGFDHLSLNIRYQGPIQNLQSRVEGLLGIDLAYTHFFTDRLSTVFTLSRAAGRQTLEIERSAASFREVQLAELYGPLVRISINYRFGSQRD